MSMQAILNVKNDQKLQAWLRSPLIEVQVEILTVAKVGPSFNMSMGLGIFSVGHYKTETSPNSVI